MTKHIIWDVDGTLFNTYPAFTLAFSLALIELQAPAPLDKIARLAKISLDHCVKTLAADYKIPAEALEESFNRHYQKIPFENQGPFAGVREVCELVKTRQGLNLIVTHRRLASTQRLLAVHAMSDLFEEILTSENGYARKPDPALFQILIEKYDLDSSETLAIGDREIDIQAGALTGCKTALFGDKPYPAPSDLHFAKYSELLAFLQA